jgi:spore coat polysaccharide biosynthesis protein SpsF
MFGRSSVIAKRMKPKVTAIIQARMLSKRLPGKAMLALKGMPLLYHVVERSKKIEHVDNVVLAAPVGSENRPVVDLAKYMGAGAFSGSEDNVLERYYQAAEEFGGDYIVRITGDNPFTDVDYASMAVEIATEACCDLCSISNLPLGVAVEVIKREALREAYKNASKPYYREHVTPYIKEHPELFSIERPPANLVNPFKNLRLTVDTEEDYKLASILFDNLYEGKPFPIGDVIEFLKTHRDLVQINSHIEQRSMRHSESGNEK